VLFCCVDSALHVLSKAACSLRGNELLLLLLLLLLMMMMMMMIRKRT
jgi:hypothetical protein